MGTKTTNTYLSEECHYYAAGTAALVNTGFVSKLTSSRTGVPNPKWRQILKDGGNATTVMSANTQYARIFPGICRYTLVGFGGTVYNTTDMGIRGTKTMSPSVLVSTGFDQLVAQAQAKAVHAVYSRIAQLQSPFIGQQFLGELRECKSLMIHPFKEASKLTENFLRVAKQDKTAAKFIANRKIYERPYRHLPFKKVLPPDRLTEFSKSTADAWLQYSFAVKPLFADIGNLLVLAADIAGKRDHEIVRGFGEAKTSSAISSVVTGGVTGLSGVMTTTTTDTAQNIIRCGLTAEFLDKINNDGNPWFSSVNDIFTIPSAAWELLPFSFLMDYFVNVGDIIQASTVSQSALSYVSNTVVRRREIEQIATIPNITRPDLVASIVENIPKRTVMGVRSVDRSATLQWIPPVVFKLPGSNLQFANMAALLTHFL